MSSNTSEGISARRKAQRQPNDSAIHIKTRETLRHSEEKFRSLVQNTSVGISTSDTAGVFTFVNPALYLTHGYSENEVLGKPLIDFIHPDDRERVLDSFLKFRANPSSKLEIEFRTLHKDGRTLQLHTTATHIRDRGRTTGFIASMIDITGLKQTEEVLRQSEERYRTILDETQEAYYEVDLAGNFIFMNQAGSRLLGYPSSEIVGANFRFVFPEQNQQEIFKAFNQVYLTGQPLRSLPFEAILKDGKHRYGELSVFPLRNEEGKIIGFRGIGRDVTERKQMEEAMREAEGRYFALFDRSLEAVYIHDLRGNFMDANQLALDLLGYTREDISKLNFASVLDEDQMPLALQTFEELIKTGRQQAITELKLRRKDGTYIYVETDSSVIYHEGKPSAIQGIARDITERRRMEEELRQSEQKLRNIFESVNDGVFTLDLNGTYTEVNHAMLNMHRLTSKNSLIGVNAFDCVVQSNTEEAGTIIQQTIEKGTLASQQLTLRRLGDGSEFPVEISIRALTDARGNATGFVGVARDISQRKQAEEERQQLEQKAQLASRLASIGELAAGIAHEINNPLTSVIGYAQLLSGKEDIPADMKKDLKAIIDGANRVAGIVKRLLIFARQTKPQQTLVNVTDLITSALELRAYYLRNNNIKVTTRFDPKLPIITADAGQLQQVFLNIIVNAEAEMKRAHGKGRLLIGTQRVGKSIRVSFEDDGPGIARENLERIFHPFFTTKEVGEGTGLGLSICYGIIAEHKGKIWAESEPGKGAIFVVELPIVAKSSQVKQAEPEEKRTQKVAKAKILAVDDEPEILQLLSRLLTEEGYKVETADSAASAMKMISKKRYHLIILDIKMPSVDGIQLYKRVQKITPSLARRVIFMTGDVLGPETKSFLSRMKVPYVTKPFDTDKLRKEINRLLSRRQKRVTPEHP